MMSGLIVVLFQTACSTNCHAHATSASPLVGHHPLYLHVYSSVLKGSLPCTLEGCGTEVNGGRCSHRVWQGKGRGSATWHAGRGFVWVWARLEAGPLTAVWKLNVDDPSALVFARSAIHRPASAQKTASEWLEQWSYFHGWVSKWWWCGIKPSGSLVRIVQKLWGGRGKTSSTGVTMCVCIHTMCAYIHTNIEIMQLGIMDFESICKYAFELFDNLHI